MEGIGFTREEAIADLRDCRKWAAEQARRKQAPPELRFARSLEALLGLLGKGGWRIERQQATFGTDTGGQIELKLTWTGETSTWWELHIDP